jgi:hypothetical protein
MFRLLLDDGRMDEWSDFMVFREELFNLIEIRRDPLKKFEMHGYI